MSEDCHNICRITRNNFDALTLHDVREILAGLIRMVNTRLSTDEANDLLYPLIRMAELSILGRRPVDVETLAAQVAIVLEPYQDDHVDVAMLKRNIQSILV